jgi:energy-coupling factor transport system permease protein
VDRNKLIHAEWDPRTKLILVISVIIAALGSSTWPGLGLVTVFLILWHLKEKVPAETVLRNLRTLWLLFFFTIVMHTLFSGGTPEMKIGFIPIHFEGFRKGIFMVTRLLLMVWAATLLTFNTSPLRLTQGIDAILSPLRKWRLPAGEAAMMIGISARFLPILSWEANRIKEAQALRGVNFKEGKVTQRIKNLVPVLVPLLGAALRRADELGDALQARAYHPANPRTFLHPLRFDSRDKLLSILGISIGVAIALLF